MITTRLGSGQHTTWRAGPYTTQTFPFSFHCLWFPYAAPNGCAGFLLLFIIPATESLASKSKCQHKNSNYHARQAGRGTVLGFLLLLTSDWFLSSATLLLLLLQQRWIKRLQMEDKLSLFCIRCVWLRCDFKSSEGSQLLLTVDLVFLFLFFFFFVSPLRPCD